MKIKIPAGVDDGARLRVAGEGEPGVRGGGHGDLYVYIFVRRDPKFSREGNDILSQETISFAQAALGAKIPVETLDGKIELTIPAGTQTGTVFRIRGKGVPVLGSRTAAATTTSGHGLRTERPQCQTEGTPAGICLCWRRNVGGGAKAG